MLHPFHVVIGELSKLYLEAKDNLKFLTTLERHFKNVSDGLSKSFSQKNRKYKLRKISRSKKNRVGKLQGFQVEKRACCAGDGSC